MGEGYWAVSPTCLLPLHEKKLIQIRKTKILYMLVK
jgi:hypothetical protein